MLPDMRQLYFRHSGESPNDVAVRQHCLVGPFQWRLLRPGNNQFPEPWETRAIDTAPLMPQYLSKTR